MADDAATTTAALVLLAKWPGSGASKTRLARQLAAADTNQGGAEHAEDARLDEAQQWVAQFVRASVGDLIERFGTRARGWRCVLLYAPPVDEARAWFSPCEVLPPASYCVLAHTAEADSAVRH